MAYGLGIPCPSHLSTKAQAPVHKHQQCRALGNVCAIPCLRKSIATAPSERTYSQAHFNGLRLSAFLDLACKGNDMRNQSSEVVGKGVIFVLIEADIAIVIAQQALAVIESAILSA